MNTNPSSEAIECKVRGPLAGLLVSKQFVWQAHSQRLTLPSGNDDQQATMLKCRLLTRVLLIPLHCVPNTDFDFLAFL